MLNDLIQEELMQACEFISRKGLSPATAGNFSHRMDDKQMWISASGKDKSRLSKKDFVVCDFDANLIQGEGKPSAEANLHGMIYRLANEADCVLHTHSAAVTVLSMLKSTDHILFIGYEMQKTIHGFQSHEESFPLSIFDNDQNIPQLAKQVHARWHEVRAAHGFIVRGHGLYSWGASVFEAKRHMEGLEFMLECELLKNKVVNS